jgi:glutaredoxin 3
MDQLSDKWPAHAVPLCHATSLSPEALFMVDITIYIKRRCVHCLRAKRRLRRYGITYREERASGNSALARAKLTALFGRDTFPQIVIAGQHIGGASELAALDKSGELARIVAQAAADAPPP